MHGEPGAERHHRLPLPRQQVQDRGRFGGRGPGDQAAGGEADQGRGKLDPAGLNRRVGSGHAARGPGARPHRLLLCHGLPGLRPGHGGQRHRPAGRVPRAHRPVLAVREAAHACGGAGRGAVLLGAGAVLRAGAAGQPEHPGVPALPAGGAGGRHRP
ncbi:hypothetical protein SGPA1_20036 [Streptomyces misionensis JCM 4497]